MYESHQINALILLKPEEATKIILQALRKAKMHKAKAAKILGCSHATLIRWFDRLDMRDKVDRLQERAKREGWHFEPVRSGRPKGSLDSYPRERRWKKAPRVTLG